ncbi:MAG: hypothetical protein ABT07_01370 [Microbacterium sp. SCN 70-10]|nr:MAG: hypothetical protein ABT07_01370 [Microbacterium sp. SCN 70-10]
MTQGILVGGSMAGGGTAVFALIELMRSEPERAFALLQTWGPGFLLALFVAWSISRIITRALDVVERVGDRFAGSMENVAIEQRSLAEAAHAQAMAMQTMADKDDREKQEMQILVGVVNSKVEQTLDEQKRQSRTLERIEDALKINRPLSESEQ